LAEALATHTRGNRESVRSSVSGRSGGGDKVQEDLREEEREAKDFFEGLGLTVAVVPRGSERTAEFLVDGDGRGYAVEVKARLDSAEWRKAIHAGEVALQSRPIGWGSWAEEVVRKGALKQLAAVDPEHRRWWVVWFAVQAQAARSAMGEQVFGSLFGVRQVISWKDGGGAVARSCLFARPGVFERHPEIVAAMVQPGQGQYGLALNDFAPDLPEFKSSRLYRDMVTKNAISDAERLCGAGGFLRVKDLSIDRRSEEAVIAHLIEVYGPGPAYLVDMEEHTGTIRVPDESGRSSQDKP
jgi:hypothetical protein